MQTWFSGNILCIHLFNVSFTIIVQYKSVSIHLTAITECSEIPCDQNTKYNQTQPHARLPRGLLSPHSLSKFSFLIPLFLLSCFFLFFLHSCQLPLDFYAMFHYFPWWFMLEGGCHLFQLSHSSTATCFFSFPISFPAGHINMSSNILLELYWKKICVWNPYLIDISAVVTQVVGALLGL